ncbi:hypothetical protein F5Y16DRAFT_398832 [Xylariaceae sp. FL0255]|nr:hypothetical protein F5Y16DRAFT_398832 [Xylariaceae sp. FL0255]
MNGDGQDPCVGADDSKQFWVPQGAEVYNFGDTIPFSWDAGNTPYYDATGDDSTTAMVQLELEWTVGLQTISLIIMNESKFTFGLTGNWIYHDKCKNSQMTYNWFIPTTQGIPNDTSVTVSAVNISGSSQIVMASSQPFVIQSVMSSLPAASTSRTTVSPTSTQPIQTTGTAIPLSPGLTTGGKIGLSVAIPIGSILLALMGWAILRRRHERRHGMAIVSTPAQSDKPEVEGPLTRQAELSGDGLKKIIDGDKSQPQMLFSELEECREPQELE